MELVWGLFLPVARTQRSKSAASRGPRYFAWGCFRDFLSSEQIDRTKTHLALAGRANRQSRGCDLFRDEFADPVSPYRFDMPCHRLGRGRRRVGDVLADLLAVEPAAAVRIADFADQPDGFALPQLHISVGGEERS